MNLTRNPDPAGRASRHPGARLRTWLVRAGIFCLLTMVVLPAAAESVKYRVNIRAPENLVKLLQENLDIVRWAGRDDVGEDQLRQLTKTAPDQVRSLLATEGYFSPTVNSQLLRDDAGWVAELLVEPGESTRVVSVDFRITGAITADPERDRRVAQARSQFLLNEGATFRQADWEAGKEGAVHSLHRRRYAAAKIVSSRAEIDPAARQARLLVEIDSGPPFTFGEVQVTGLRRYSREMIRNLSPVKPGDPYDEEQLLKYQRRLLAASGRFASAVVSAGSNPESAAATPIYVSLVESAARTVELGVGYSTDRGPRFQAGYTDRDALDQGLQLDAKLKVDRLSEELVGALTLPRNAQGWRYGLEGKYNEQDIQGEKRIDWSVTGAHTYTVEERESQQSLQLLTENRQLVSGPEDNRKALFLAQTWSWNGLDDLLAPSSGYFARLQVGGASRDIGSDRTFGRVVAKGSYFQPVGTFGTLVLRLETGAVIADTRDNIPSAYLFRTGGDTTVRGYAFESLGVEEGGAIVGGRYLAIGSVEYIQWITREWGAAVFYDAGNAVDEMQEFRPAAGYGVGARWRSPLGALSLDVAYGEKTEQFRVHFNVGFVFR